MKIYVGHSSSFDFHRHLYKPLRSSNLNKQHEIVLPHEFSEDQYNPKGFLKKCDLMIAEVSHPSIGLGIELGWADIFETPIVCVYQRRSNISDSVGTVASEMLEYKDASDLVKKLSDCISKMKD